MNSSLFAEIALLGALAFSILLILLHFIKPEIDPRWRMISEYEIGRYGWIMRLAFFCWAVGFFALSVPLRGHVSMTGVALLALCAIGDLGAAIFAADPITTPNTSVSRTGQLHTMFGALFILGFPIGATVIDWNLSTDAFVAPIQSYLPWMSLLVWLGLITMGTAFVVLGIKKVELGPQAFIGWPNRFMVLTYVVWQVMIASAIVR